MSIIIIVLLFTFICQTSVQAIDYNQLLTATNQKRTANKIAPLVINSKLNSAASIKVHDMIDNNYWSHVSPKGVTPSMLLKNVGYRYRVMGENLADGYDSAEAVVNAWMDSPSHRKNIHNPKFCEVGFASEGNLTVQMFGCGKKL